MDWTQTLVPPETSIHETIRAINANRMQICLVVDENRRLLGTVNDGDIRRAILAGRDFSEPVERIMNARPHVGGPDESRDALLARMAETRIHQIPILDAGGRVIDLIIIEDLVGTTRVRENWVVLMAGGLGRRLRPLTDEAPKPLLPVGKKPLLETILETFVEQDFRRFYMAVNYKAQMIRDHFGDGSRWGAEIRYLDEDRPLGTAGALRLIPEAPQGPANRHERRFAHAGELRPPPRLPRSPSVGGDHVRTPVRLPGPLRGGSHRRRPHPKPR